MAKSALPVVVCLIKSKLVIYFEKAVYRASVMSIFLRKYKEQIVQLSVSCDVSLDGERFLPLVKLGPDFSLSKIPVSLVKKCKSKQTLSTYDVTNARKTFTLGQ